MFLLDHITVGFKMNKKLPKDLSENVIIELGPDG